MDHRADAEECGADLKQMTWLVSGIVTVTMEIEPWQKNAAENSVTIGSCCSASRLRNLVISVCQMDLYIWWEDKQDILAKQTTTNQTTK